jgi:hypothetical protein
MNDSLIGGHSQSIGNTQSTDIMMLKRLNFLRNQLQTHNPRETTQYNRELAEQQRNERILELWKLDQEKPSVYELVQNMRKRRQEENITSREFNQLMEQVRGHESSAVTPYVDPYKGSGESITIAS